MKTRSIIFKAALPTVILGLIITVATGVVMDTKAALGATIGTVLVVVFFTIGQLALDRVIRTNPSMATSMALLIYLLKIGVLFVLLLLFKDTTAFNTKVFAATIMGCTILWLVAEVWAFATAKTLYVEPGSGPDVMPLVEPPPFNQ